MTPNSRRWVNFHGPFVLQFLFTLVLCKPIYSESVFCAPSTAAVSSTAETDVRILVLLDLHDSDEHGLDCAELDTGALVAMEALSWVVSDLNKKDAIPGIKIGKILLFLNHVNCTMSKYLRLKELYH